MKSIPIEMKPYKRTKTFTETTVPNGLLNNHQTLPNVWGKIVVLEGHLKYVIQTNPSEENLLTPENFGVVEPEIIHCVQPTGKVVFYVEFYK